MIVCSVLSVKPYSGYYRACNTCLGKVLQNQESRWWCRKCSCVISSEEVHLRYCVAVTITDHSTPPQDTVVFGKSCNPIFGCSAELLKRYVVALEDRATHHLLHKAIEEVMIGQCFGFTFFVPPTYKHSTGTFTLSTFINLNKKLKRDVKRVELIAMEIKVLSGDLDTVLSKLKHRIDDSSPPSAVSGNPSVEHTLQHTHEDSSFFPELVSEATPSQNPSLLLETFVDSPQLTGISSSTQQCATPGPVSTLSASSKHPPLFLSHTETLTQNIFSPQAAIDKTINEYLSELTRNESLLKEMESDWESTQNNGPSPSGYRHPYYYSEEMLRELHEPFSQLREHSPSLPTSHTSITLTPSNSSTSIAPGCLSTPELFSPNSTMLEKTRVSVRPAQPQLFTPSPLVCVSQSNSSPELFGSSSKLVTEQNNPTDTHLSLQTPMCSTRPHLPRRKLVQCTSGRERPASMLALSYHSPHEPNPHSSQSVAYCNGFSPDIL